MGEHLGPNHTSTQTSEYLKCSFIECRHVNALLIDLFQDHDFGIDNGECCLFMHFLVSLCTFEMFLQSLIP